MKTGLAKFYFKGMEMKHQKSTVIFSNLNRLMVTQNIDKTPLNFVNIEGRWLLKDHTNRNSPLYGSEFVFEK